MSQNCLISKPLHLFSGFFFVSAQTRIFLTNITDQILCAMTSQASLPHLQFNSGCNFKAFKCHLRECPVNASEPQAIECAAFECTRLAHYPCYQSKVLFKWDLADALNVSDTTLFRVACIKKCHSAAIAQLSRDPQHTKNLD